MPSLIVRAINSVGRLIEFCLTGQTDYALTTSDFCLADTIDNSVQAKLAMKELLPYLQQKFGIVLQAPIIINLEKPRTRSWKRVVFSAGEHIGSYTSRWLGENLSHEILLAPGMERRKFKAVLAHELTHAFQAERRLLRTHKGLKEGMARWVEYHVLNEVGLKREADKLCRYRSFILGRGIITILNYEREHGRTATLKWLKDLA
ncbi:hypothetical protein IJT17_01480 [bacterium]|nr:hypothetical protein [bacterium]